MSTTYAGDNRGDQARRVQIGVSQEYLQTVLRPAVIGGALGVLTFAAFVIFFVVSACCKCCSKTRGCCQRSVAMSYRRRLGWIAVGVLAGVLAAVGAVIVLSSAPTFVDALRAMFDDFLAKVRARKLPSCFWCVQSRERTQLDVPLYQ